MVQLLVLTDFSDNATHAAKCAIKLAVQLNADILLFHDYPLLSAAPVLQDENISTDKDGNLFMDTGHRLRDLEAILLEEINKLRPGRRPNITLLSDVGGLGGNVADIVARYEVEIIIMGARQSSGFSHLLEGSATATVIDSATVPVLIIPPGKDCLWQKIMLATAFKTGDFAAINWLSTWKLKLTTELSIAHVSTNDADGFSNIADELLFRESFARMKDQYNFSYQDVRGDNVSERLLTLCHTEKIDLLALVHYQRGLLARLTGTSKTIAFIDHHYLPVMVFPPANNEVK